MAVILDGNSEHVAHALRKILSFLTADPQYCLKVCLPGRIDDMENRWYWLGGSCRRDNNVIVQQVTSRLAGIT